MQTDMTKVANLRAGRPAQRRRGPLTRTGAEGDPDQQRLVGTGGNRAMARRRDRRRPERLARTSDRGHANWGASPRPRRSPRSSRCSPHPGPETSPGPTTSSTVASSRRC